MNNELVKAGKEVLEAHIGTLGYREVYTPAPEEARTMVAYNISTYADDPGAEHIAEQIHLIEAVGSEYLNYNECGHASIFQGTRVNTYSTLRFEEIFQPWGRKTVFKLKELAEKYGISVSVSEFIALGDNGATEEAEDLGDDEFIQANKEEALKSAEFLKVLIDNGELPKAKYLIRGNSFPVKDQLKELGAKFNGNGWEIELEKLEEAKAIVANQ